LANFRFDPSADRVLRIGGNGPSAPKVPTVDDSPARISPTNVLVLREGKIYFEGAADEILHSTDEYLKRFLASAE